MTIVQVNFSTTREVCSIKRPSHVKLMLANSCWETQIGVCERHNNLRKVGENRDKFYLPPTDANMLLCPSHTLILDCQHELTNISLTCEGRLRDVS